uniref:Sec-independent protein translocase protein n=1 Tax=Psilotum nudum TaxID=3240 RepID=A0A1B3TRJ8_PSINU|nr:Sec-independent protein translocase protein [Psilotum nudum]AOH05933.1 Sec-independent protein translocase protein [Psilotum nudum]
MNLGTKTIMEESRIRGFRILIRFSLTWLSRYWFPEEFILSLAKPFITSPYPDSYFICTQSTEASSTYVTMSLISCFYFVFPSLGYQIWCSFIPSCYNSIKKQYKNLFYSSGFRFFPFFPVTLVWVVPNVRHFSYHPSTTSTNSLMIKLQPRIYDYILLTVGISFISPIRSQVPFMVICSLESKAIDFRTCLKNRRILMVFSFFTAALFTPPDIWCQIVACSSLSFPIEFTIFVALIIPVYENKRSG